MQLQSVEKILILTSFYACFIEIFTDDDDDVFTTVDNKKWRERELPPDEYAKTTQIKYLSYIYENKVLGMSREA